MNSNDNDKPNQDSFYRFSIFDPREPTEREKELVRKQQELELAELDAKIKKNRAEAAEDGVDLAQFTFWPDTQVALAAFIVDLYDKRLLKGLIQINSRQSAVKELSRHFMILDKKDGRLKRVNPENCWKSYDKNTR